MMINVPRRHSPAVDVKQKASPAKHELAIAIQDIIFPILIKTEHDELPNIPAKGSDSNKPMSFRRASRMR